MTVKEVEERVYKIDQSIRDDEVAHGAEDELHQDVLQAIAEGAENASGLAAAALKTKDLNFARWYG